MRKYKQVVYWDDGFVEEREVEYKDFQEIQRAVKAEMENSSKSMQSMYISKTS